ncbi:MAG TPA: hypothetical protein VHU86_03425 [Solirubrobacterales bacterium]|nr:hypothetical protein [Solirubrobacterales bacterium]
MSASSRGSAISDTAWDVQDRLRNGLPEAGRTLVELVTWAFDQVSFGLRRKVLWPAEDRAGTLGPPARKISFAAVVMLAALAGVAGLIWAAPDRPSGSTAAETVSVASKPVAKPAPAPEEAPAGPTLHGAAPDFKPAAGGEVGSAKAIEASSTAKSSPPADSSPAASSAAKASTDSNPATASSTAPQSAPIDGPPAGPAAVSVAHEFASAFVLYETGADAATVRKAFGETATPQLSHSLLRRPPRLPANVKVPKAKVVNVVPGPSHGGVYTVSVSLLRVGLTSELRLDMERLKKNQWRVTNVLG